VPFLEELQRAPQPSHGGIEHRIADKRRLFEELQGIPRVLAGPLEGGIALGAAAALQGAAPLGAAPSVDHAAALARHARQGLAPWHGTPVDAVAAVGEQTGGRQDGGNVAPAGRCIQKRCAAVLLTGPSTRPARSRSDR
jgi:hypothetical protein